MKKITVLILGCSILGSHLSADDGFLWRWTKRAAWVGTGAGLMWTINKLSEEKTLQQDSVSNESKEGLYQEVLSELIKEASPENRRDVVGQNWVPLGQAASSYNTQGSYSPLLSFAAAIDQKSRDTVATGSLSQRVILMERTQGSSKK